MDGLLVEPAWNSGNWRNIANVTVGPYGMAASARFKAYWDNAYLYVGVGVSKTPAALYSGTPLWSSDSIELYFDMANNGAATYDANDFHYTFGWNNPVPEVSAGGSLAGVGYSYVNTGNGWSAEIAIPWSSLGVSAAQGALYGFDAAANIASAPGARQCQLTWNSSTADNYMNTSQFGELSLGAACPPMSPTRTPTLSASTATPSRTATPSPSPTNTAVTRGATLPYYEHEAENGATNGTVLGPSRTVGTIAAESSGRRAVQLDATGEYVSFSSGPESNSIVVRYVIPDSAGGGGINATLSLYINGAFRQKLNLTSKYAWAYGGWGIPYNQNPSGGGAVHFYDEVRALCGGIPAGATVRLQKDADDTAAYYVVDLVDLEMVGPALSMPANFLSITDYGATPNDASNDVAAIQNCINAAKGVGWGVWIPAGTFVCSSTGLNANNVTVRGAGMWYSVLSGLYARFETAGNNSRFHDFAVFGDTVNRVDTSPDNAFNGHGGTGSRLENIWVEHTKCAWWVGNTGPTTNGLFITGCRFRNLYADAVNFCNGTSNSTLTNSHARNTGDDAFASWSPTAQGSNTNNLFSFNTVQLPWRANCIAVYGGSANRVEDNLLSDTSNYPGILIGQEFTSNAFSGTTRVLRNTLTRCGGPFGGTNHGALKISSAQGAVNGIQLGDNTIADSSFAGIYLAGGNAINSTTFSNISITGPATWGIQTATGTGGTVNCDYVTVSGAGSGGLQNTGGLNFIKGAGNTGW